MGAFRKLMAMIEVHSKPQIQEAALAILLQISRGSRYDLQPMTKSKEACLLGDNQTYLFQTNMLPLLVSLLDPRKSDTILTATTWVFGAFTVHGKHATLMAVRSSLTLELAHIDKNRERVFSSGAVPALLSCLQSSNETIGNQTVCAFTNCFQNSKLYEMSLWLHNFNLLYNRDVSFAVSIQWRY